MNFNKLMEKIPFTSFVEVIELSPRKVRGSIFSHYGIKSKPNSFLSMKDRKEARLKRLHQALQQAKNPKEQEFLKELFRNWLLHKRAMLKSALDFLEVENDNGLVETEVDFFKELSQERVKALIEHLLSQNFPKDHIYIYLKFMEVPSLEQHLEL